jgi:hypothetical protein
MRAADRVHLPVPRDQFPTVHPRHKSRMTKPTVSAVRKSLKYWRGRLPVRSTFEPPSQCDWWGTGDCRQLVTSATGLLMIGGIDTAGNPYGSSFHRSLDANVSAWVTPLSSSRPARIRRRCKSLATTCGLRITPPPNMRHHAGQHGATQVARHSRNSQ